VKNATFSYWGGKKTLLIGMLFSVLGAAYILAPVPGGIAASHPTGSEVTAMTGATETATFALG